MPGKIQSKSKGRSIIVCGEMLTFGVKGHYISIIYKKKLEPKYFIYHHFLIRKVMR